MSQCGGMSTTSLYNVESPTRHKNHTTRDADRKSVHSQCVYFEGTFPCE